MNQPHPEQALSLALQDVRRAYRLMHAYQRRISDLLAEVDGKLSDQGLTFDQWAPVFNSPPPRKSTPFFRRTRWAWDMLPGHAVGCFWKDKKRRKGLRRRLLLQVITDTGRTYDGEEPDPARFIDVAECTSEVRIGHWTTTSAKPDWSSAWQEVKASDWNWEGRCKVKVGEDEYTYEYSSLDLSRLVDADATRTLLIEPLVQWASSPLAEKG